MNEEQQNRTALTPEQVEAIQAVIDIIADILNPIIEAVKIAIDCINGIWEDFMRTLNPKVQHLAIHAKSKRARNKNRKRMWLEFQRYCKEVQNEK
jgi:phage-related protein